MKTKKKRNNLNKTMKNNENNGFMTSIWGPAIWHFLHIISFNYPLEPSNKNKKDYYNYIISLKNILPCRKCRENLVKNFKQLPLTMKDMKNRYTFSLYVYNLHELINTMLHKKSNLTYEDVKNKYETYRAKNCNTTHKTELGCSKALYGKKKKCIIKII